MYRVRLARRADRYYQGVASDTARRLDQCFERLSRNPFGAGDVRPLRGMRGMYRYRVGGLRVLFTVDQRERIVTVTRLGHEEIYFNQRVGC